MGSAVYLFSHWKRLEKGLEGRFIWLFLDYDGTLAPIARTPEMAVMPKGTKGLLRRLSKKSNCRIAVVSGRALRDISRRIGLKNIVYVGNHGFEIKGPKVRFKSPVSWRYKKTLEEIRDKLKVKLSHIRGVVMEDKGPSISVHYRLASRADRPKVKTGFYAAIFPHVLKGEVRPGSGKMVLEVRPPISWDKGRAVSWLLGRRLSGARDKKLKVLPVYIGDDTTDEDAFKALKDIGITIFVGHAKKTRARFYLKDTSDVARFLKAIIKKVNSVEP